MSLSSSSLFHYTSKFENLKNIILEGFKFSPLREELPLKGFSGSIFYGKNVISYQFEWHVVCFCDIPLNMISDHIDQYGHYGIGLTKDWGIRNRVTPIRYVHENSPGLDDDFMISLHSEQYIKQFGNSFINMFVQVMRDEGELSDNFSPNELSNLSVDTQKILKGLDDYIQGLHKYIVESGGYCRTYSGSWEDRVTKDRKEKIFYDEQEWRALSNNPTNKLIFNFDDITHIFVETPNEQSEITQLIKQRSNEMAIGDIGKISDKVHLINKFNKNG